MQRGIPGEFDHPAVREAYRRTIEACRAHGKRAGMGGVYQHAIMAEQIAASVRLVLGGSDLNFMMQAGRK